jgi:hypothetical protein
MMIIAIAIRARDGHIGLGRNGMMVVKAPGIRNRQVRTRIDKAAIPKTAKGRVRISDTPRKAAAHIMGAPEGVRTVSHQRIQAAIEKVFGKRTRTDA